MNSVFDKIIRPHSSFTSCSGAFDRIAAAAAGVCPHIIIGHLTHAGLKVEYQSLFLTPETAIDKTKQVKKKKKEDHT